MFRQPTTAKPITHAAAAIRRNGPAFIEEVIQEAQKNFVTGVQNNQLFVKELAQNTQLKASVRSSHSKFPQYKDPYFTDWNANRIEGTNFVASQGPKNEADVGKLISNTVFNAHMPIANIVALGDDLAYLRGNQQDFHDYCIQERDAIFGEYTVDIQRISGNPSSDFTGDHQSPNGIVQSRLLISTGEDDTQQSTASKQLNITLIGLKDNTALYLGGGITELIQKMSWFTPFYQSCDERKEILWQLYQKSLSEPILIHCAAGLGRTGHIILTLEILKHYDDLFASNEPRTVAAGIHEILNRIRRNRPALILVKVQFEEAIRNAEILHQYALKKGYIQTDTTPINSAELNTEAPTTLLNVDQDEEEDEGLSYCPIM